MALGIDFFIVRHQGINLLAQAPEFRRQRQTKTTSFLENPFFHRKASSPNSHTTCNLTLLGENHLIQFRTFNSQDDCAKPCDLRLAQVLPRVLRCSLNAHVAPLHDPLFTAVEGQLQLTIYDKDVVERI